MPMHSRAPRGLVAHRGVGILLKVMGAGIVDIVLKAIIASFAFQFSHTFQACPEPLYFRQAGAMVMAPWFLWGATIQWCRGSLGVGDRLAPVVKAPSSRRRRPAIRSLLFCLFRRFVRTPYYAQGRASL